MADFDANALLAFAESTLRKRRQLEVDDLSTGAHWAVLHAADPTHEPPDGRTTRGHVRHGGPKLVQIGGDGTPKVQDLCLAELAVSRQTHVLATRWLVADALDLMHRLPLCWTVVEALECEVWVARKLARATRELSFDEVSQVDAAVSTALAGEQPGRFFTILEAKIMEANPEAWAARIDAERARRYVSIGRVDEAGLRHVIARVEHGDAIWIDALVNRVADILHAQDTAAVAAGNRSEVRDRDLLRSVAFGWLARPAELLALLLEHAEDPDQPDAAQPETDTPDPVPLQPNPHTDPEDPETASPEPDPEDSTRRDWTTGFPARLLTALRSIDPAKLRPAATVYVHLHEAALRPSAASDTGGCVARIEEGGGPRLVQHLADLLGHAQVTLKPVIDLNDRVSVNAYEFPQWLRERVHLISPADPFPYATRSSRKGDIDHTSPFRHGRPGQPAPPGQTSTHNAAPLGRYAHRVKTHAQFTVRQLGPGSYLWRTPHGKHFLVDHNGTQPVDESMAHALTRQSEMTTGPDHGRTPDCGATPVKDTASDHHSAPDHGLVPDRDADRRRRQLQPHWLRQHHRFDLRAHWLSDTDADPLARSDA